MSKLPARGQPAGMPWPAVLWRGMLMGLAEVVPGVSGGTIALITGIYRRLVGGLAGFNLDSFRLIFSPVQFWQRHDLAFLATLFAGMLIGVLIFARLMGYLINHYPPVVWGFFFGVIGMSVFRVASDAKAAGRLYWPLAALGVMLGLALAFAPSMQGAPHWLGIMAAGALAICAWILPAVSGSYLLLVLGLYDDVLTAVNNLDLVFVALFASGCVLGLMAFARLLRWLLERFYAQLLSLLCGLMLGSMLNLWPWRLAGVSGWERYTGPQAYQLAMPHDSFVVASVIAAVAGAGFIAALTRYSAGRRNGHT